MAVQLNVTPQAVSKWENGSFPDGTLLPQIADILHISLDILFGLKEEEPEPDYLKEYIRKISALDELERTEQVIEALYRLLCAYDKNIPPHQVQFPENLKWETYAQLRADSAIGLFLTECCLYSGFYRMKKPSDCWYFPKLSPEIIF